MSWHFRKATCQIVGSSARVYQDSPDQMVAVREVTAMSVNIVKGHRESWTLRESKTNNLRYCPRHTDPLVRQCEHDPWAISRRYLGLRAYKSGGTTTTVAAKSTATTELPETTLSSFGSSSDSRCLTLQPLGTPSDNSRRFGWPKMAEECHFAYQTRRPRRIEQFWRADCQTRLELISQQLGQG
jgi:hypothetical protein